MRLIKTAAAAAMIILLSGCTPFIIKESRIPAETPDTPETPVVAVSSNAETETEPDKSESSKMTSSKTTSSNTTSSKATSSKTTSSKTTSSKTTSSKTTSSKTTSSKTTSSKTTSSKTTSSKMTSSETTSSKTENITSSAVSSSESTESEQEQKAEYIVLSLPSTQLYEGSTVTLTSYLMPENAEDGEIEFTVSDNSVVILGGDGTVTALGEGECTISAQLADDKNVTGELTVTVIEKPEPSETENFYANGILIVNKTYSITPDEDPGGLTPECAAAFEQLVNGAAEAGYYLYSNSDYRSYYDQQAIYDNYVYSYGQAMADSLCSIPGHSEHQTGLAIDVAAYSTYYFPGSPEAEWLAAHCADYGFIIRYPYGKEYSTGYSYEAWHIRYVGDIAWDITNSGLSLEEYCGL